jgi:hypothetical protein
MGNGADFQIQVEGTLSERWTSWFTGMTIAVDEATDALPITTLAGPLADQAALLGVLYTLHNLGLVITLVRRQRPPGQRTQGSDCGGSCRDSTKR